MQRIILLHGNGGGSGSDNWFPWLQAKLTTDGYVCLAPNLPDPVGAHASVWLPYIKNELHADENTVLIGHSSGAIAAMRYAETHRVHASILVGTYYTDLGYDDEKASGYFDTAWDWQAIKDNQNWTMIFASLDDPFIAIDEPRFIRDQLASEYYEFEHEGHFGDGASKRKFPELYDALKAKLTSIPKQSVR